MDVVTEGSSLFGSSVIISPRLFLHIVVLDEQELVGIDGVFADDVRH